MSSAISFVFMYVGTHVPNGGTGRCRMLMKSHFFRSFKCYPGQVQTELSLVHGELIKSWPRSSLRLRLSRRRSSKWLVVKMMTFVLESGA